MTKARGIYLAIACVLFLSIFSLAVDAQPAEKVLGVGTHVIGLSAGEQMPQLDLIARANLNSVRADVPWKFVEATPGQLAIPAAWDRFVDAALKRGVKPVLILDYGNPFYDDGDKPRSARAIEGFVRYATFVAGHFKGRVTQFEIWNEWDNNTGGFPGASSEDYARLFKSAYPALKSLFPECTFLVSSGISPSWYERLAQLGVVGIGDGVAFHPYNYQSADPLAPEHSALRVLNLEAMLVQATGKGAVDIYVTEIGWPTNIGRFGLSENTVADYVSRSTLTMLSMPFVKGVWWYDLKDDGPNPLNKEHRFGLVQADLSPKPAFGVIAQIADFIRQNRIRLDPRSDLDKGLVAIRTESLKDDQAGLLLWAERLNSGALSVRCEEPDRVVLGHGVGRAARANPDGPLVVRAVREGCSFHPVFRPIAGQ